MLLAVRNDKHITYATLAEVFDTLRLLADSMDVLDKDGNGWEVFDGLCHNANVSTTYGDLKSKMADLTWMLKLWSFELKFASHSGFVEAADDDSSLDETPLLLEMSHRMMSYSPYLIHS